MIRYVNVRCQLDVLICPTCRHSFSVFGIIGNEIPWCDAEAISQGATDYCPFCGQAMTTKQLANEANAALDKHD
jgi:uncharacterized protein YbaR (Trm112 family)